MNFRQLEYFLTVAETKNISAAARRIHMAQPPLSRQLQLLEEELDTQLFLRSNKGIELTDAGRSLYLEARKLFAKVEEIKENVRDSENCLRGNIRIAACYSTLPVFLRGMSRFLDEHPLVRFSLLHGTAEEMMQLVVDGSVDMLFLRTKAPSNDRLLSRVLQSDPMRLVLNRDMDSCPERESFPLTLLESLPLCLLDGKHYPGYSAPLLDCCRKYEITPRIVCECYDTSVAMMLAINRVAATVLPLSVVSGYSHPSICVKEIENVEMKSSPTVIWNPEKQLSRSAKEFLCGITAEASSFAAASESFDVPLL